MTWQTILFGKTELQPLSGENEMRARHMTPSSFICDHCTVDEELQRRASADREHEQEHTAVSVYSGRLLVGYNKPVVSSLNYLYYFSSPRV